MQENMVIKWFGTASIAIETEYEKILFDPFIPLSGAQHSVFEGSFSEYDKIFLTHGHIDHLSSIPEIIDKSKAIVYCTKTPHDTLISKGVSEDQITEISPGDSYEFSGIKINVYQGKHIKFDAKLVLATLFSSRMIKHFNNISFIARENKICRENGETVCFEIIAENKRVFLMGSLGLDEAFHYPIGMDLLVLPYQGSSNLLAPALSITDRLKPNMILLDHYDDTFPPVSNHIETREFMDAVKVKFPDIKVVGAQSVWPVTAEI